MSQNKNASLLAEIRQRLLPDGEYSYVRDFARHDVTALCDALTAAEVERYANGFAAENQALRELLDQKLKLIGLMDAALIDKGVNFDFSQALEGRSE